MVKAISSLGKSFLAAQEMQKEHDFIIEALDLLQTEEIKEELTEEERSLVMTVFLDEKKAKVFCSAKDITPRLSFLRREIRGLDYI